MKPTHTNLAEFYNTTRQTIAEYKKNQPRRYEAFKEYFIKHFENIKSEVKAND